MIHSPLLSSTDCFIAGRWVGAESGERFRVVNPANGECLAEVPLMGAPECDRAIEAAMQAMQHVPSIAARQKALLAIVERLLAERHELGRIITLEHGKPLREGVAETEYAASFFRFFAENLEHLSDRELPHPIRECRWRVHLRPAGVAAAIGSWNFPLAMLAKKVAPALAAGCGVVVKPASLTPLSAIALGYIAEQAGVPAGFLNIVVGKSQEIGRSMCSHPAIRVISFTGSTEVGKELALAAATSLKRCTLELGGNAPFIVFSDADLPSAADALIANKFRSGGQTCVCANRIYVQHDVYRSFVDLVAERTRRLRVGNGMEPSTDIGPLINLAGFDKVAEHVQDAQRRGAERIVGEDAKRPSEDWGCFYPPTLLINVQPNARVCCEETFGPLIAVSAFKTDDEVMRYANGTEYGLAAYIFTNSSERAARCVDGLHFGHVGVNSGTGPTAEAPFGGMKQSGYGREGGIEGLLEYCEPQTVAQGRR